MSRAPSQHVHALQSSRSDVAIIGGGQAGLALSCVLGRLGVPHVVLERGQVAERWRSERWDSLRLLTPNWLSRLPGLRYQGADPHGFMRAGELADHLERYARACDAPVRTDTRVLSVRTQGDGFCVQTDQGALRARAVVIATGDADRPLVPAVARELPSSLLQLSPAQYKRPGELPDGGVLIVGASASGAQLADELQRSGRQVTLAVGRHLRVPRSYRGRDLFFWLDRMGLLRQRARDVPDLARARAVPSYQLIGRSAASVDLPSLRAQGVQLTGRLLGLDGNRALFADDLAGNTRAADDKLDGLLGRIDAFALTSGLVSEIDPPDRPERVPAVRALRRCNLVQAGIRSVIWATGFSRSYPWLQVPGALDDLGQLRQREGVLAVPGLFALGLRFMRRRDSHFIDGVGRDAEALAPLVLQALARRSAPPPIRYPLPSFMHGDDRDSIDLCP